MEQKKKIYTINKSAVKVIDGNGKPVFNTDSELVFLRITFMEMLEEISKAKCKFLVYKFDNGTVNYLVISKNTALKNKMIKHYNKKYEIGSNRYVVPFPYSLN